MPGHQHHHHGLDDDEPPWASSSMTVRRVLVGAVGTLLLATVIGLLVWWPRGDAIVGSDALGFGARVDATVRSARLEPCSYAPDTSCDVVTAEITSGDARGRTATIENPLDSASPVTLRVGDDIVLNDAGPQVPEEVRFQFADFQRRKPLLLLGALFAAAVIGLGRWRGLLALAGLALTMGVIVAFIFPALLRGSWPVGVALTGASVIAFGALYLAHGVNQRTTVAVLGTAVSLGLTALLAQVFAGAAELTGLAAEESITLLAFAPDLDFRGLLLAAVILGALGVLDDVTVTQTSAVWELHRTDPARDGRALYSSAIRIGRDHIASTVNTLVLAYAAAAMPLLLLYTQANLPAGQVPQIETISVEIVQTLVGSIGLVASVPLTTALAAWVVTRE